MKFVVLTIGLIVSVSVFAGNKHKHSHREHGAHSHGSGTLAIAFDNVKGKVDLKIASESIFGFEHVAKNAKDKKIVGEALVKLESKITEMLVFDSSLKCMISKDKIEVVQEGKHSDIVASYNVVCEKSPVGTELTFNFQMQFPKIKDLDVQVIADNVQKSVEASKNYTKLLLK
ncbi:MAG: DUF2796 domain-containing protein [Pseudobdellovibrio sp.]